MGRGIPDLGSFEEKTLMNCGVVEGHPLRILFELKKGRQLGACVGWLLPKRLFTIQRTS